MTLTGGTKKYSFLLSQMEDNEGLQELIARLTTRINSISLLLEGIVSEEFEGLI